MMVRRLVCSLCGLGVCRSCSTLHSASQLWTCAQCNQQRWALILWACNLALFASYSWPNLDLLWTCARCNQQIWDPFLAPFGTLSIFFDLHSFVNSFYTYSGPVLSFFTFLFTFDILNLFWTCPQCNQHRWAYFGSLLDTLSILFDLHSLLNSFSSYSGGAHCINHSIFFYFSLHFWYSLPILGMRPMQPK